MKQAIDYRLFAFLYAKKHKKIPAIFVIGFSKEEKQCKKP